MRLFAVSPSMLSRLFCYFIRLAFSLISTPVSAWTRGSLSWRPRPFPGMSSRRCPAPFLRSRVRCRDLESLPTLSMCTRALVWTRSGANPAISRTADRNMEKHPAWAAPISSSGSFPAPARNGMQRNSCPQKPRCRTSCSLFLF